MIAIYVVARLHCLLFVTFVRPTQPVEISGNVSGTLATHWHPGKMLWTLSREQPSGEKVKHKLDS